MAIFQRKKTFNQLGETYFRVAKSPASIVSRIGNRTEFFFPGAIYTCYKPPLTLLPKQYFIYENALLLPKITTKKMILVNNMSLAHEVEYGLE